MYSKVHSIKTLPFVLWWYVLIQLFTRNFVFTFNRCGNIVFVMWWVTPYIFKISRHCKIQCDTCIEHTITFFDVTFGINTRRFSRSIYISFYESRQHIKMSLKGIQFALSTLLILVEIFETYYFKRFLLMWYFLLIK